MSRRHSYFFICAFSSFFSFFFFFNDTATTEIYTLSLHDALPILLGSLHHLFRLLGRYRPLGHADLGDPVSVPLGVARSEEHTSELQSRLHLVCRLLLEKKKQAQPSRVRRHKSQVQQSLYKSKIQL